MSKAVKTPPQVQELKGKLVPIDSVRPDPKNAREHNERNLTTITAMLTEFGQQSHIVVDSHGVIRKGNGTWLAAKRLGWTQINVLVSDLKGRAAAKYAIGDNRSGDLSYFDDSALADQLRTFDADELTTIGFDQAELTEILESAEDVLEGEPGGSEAKQGTKGQVSVRMLVAVQNVDVVERALQATGKMNREQALLEVCESFLNLKAKALDDATGQLDAA